MSDRRLFLDVHDAARVVEELGSALFVATRLPLALGERLTLALRLPKVHRPVEVPVVVVGRRPARAGSLLSAGVLVRVAAPEHPLLGVLRELAAGNVVDLESRIQERLRLPARVSFASLDDARRELRGLLDEEGAVLDVGESFARGDRLSLTVRVGDATVASVDVLVRRLQVEDGRSHVVAVALDDHAREALATFFAGPIDQRRRG